MTLMDAAQLAAQQVQRAQAIDDLEHEAEHQAGGGEAEAEEQADAGLLQGSGSGAAVLAITRVKTRSEPRAAARCGS